MVIFIKHLLDILEYFAHKFVLVELKSLQKNDNKFDKAIDVSVIQCIVKSLLTSFGEESHLNTCLHHDLTESKQHFLVLVNTHVAKSFEEIVHIFFLVCCVLFVRHVDPLDEILLESLLII